MIKISQVLVFHFTIYFRAVCSKFTGDTMRCIISIKLLKQRNEAVNYDTKAKAYVTI